jgi:hypothetical protein
MLLTPLTDARIAELISESKTVPDGLLLKRTMSERNRHLQKGYEIYCDGGERFVIKLRQSCVNPMNFSAILGYRLPGLFSIFRLRRYNGKHRHTNSLEKQTFYDFHIHRATERYQRPGFNEDHFAEPTTRFYSLESAIQCLLSDCGFRSPIENSPLFSGKK